MTDTLATLFRELLDGPPGGMCFVLNPGDAGLLRSLDRLSAADASSVPPGHTASVAAHLDHLRYGLSLGNRWRRGEPNPFADADFSASWTRTTVDDEEWARRRAEFRREAAEWSAALQGELPEDPVARAGIVGSVVHLAYHLGAMRQIAPQLAGPPASD